MTRAKRLEQDQQRLQERVDALRKQTAAIQAHRLLETRVEEKLRIDELIAPLITEKKELEELIDGLEKELRIEKAEGMVRDARECERNEAHDPAIRLWREVADLGLSRWDSVNEIKRLDELKAQFLHRASLIKDLGKRQNELGDAYLKLVKLLREPAGRLMLTVQPYIEEFVGKQMTGAELVKQFTALQAGEEQPVGGELFDFAANLRRLQRGGIALFLGTDLPTQFDSQLPTWQKLAEELAADARLTQLPDSPAAVAEYYMKTHGQTSLVQRVYERFPAAAAPNPLYALLAKTQEPLLIITTAHDSLLEDAFQKAQRRFAVVSIVVSKTAEFRPGQILLRYSDRKQPEAPCPAEDLSKHPLLEDGYSVIFKIRGSCMSPQRPDARDLSSLVLWERRHFDFARNIDKLMPSYLGRMLLSRGLWFLGFAPTRWEDRFLAWVILESRDSGEPAIVMNRQGEGFEAEYWRSCSVVRKAMDLPEFVQNLEAAAR